jgi:VanZ family protein
MPRRPRPLYHRLAVGAFCVGVVVVAALLLMPGEDLPETGLWDKLEHTLAFAALTVLGILAFPKRGDAPLLMVGLITFGTVCEILQRFVPGRESSLADATANAIGVLVAAGLCRVVRSASTRLLASR